MSASLRPILVVLARVLTGLHVLTGQPYDAGDILQLHGAPDERNPAAKLPSQRVWGRGGR